MNYTRNFLLPALLSIAAAAQTRAQQTGAQQTLQRQKIIAYDFESPLNVAGWWVDNAAIRLFQCDQTDCGQLPGSGKCLRVQWDPVPAAAKPNTWMTDIKIDAFGDSAAAIRWSHFAENTWLSFSLNTSDGDSVYLQFIVFTKDEKDKWGSHFTIGFRSPGWKTVKTRLGSLRFDNWGKGNIAQPDFRSIVPARIEIGLRSPQSAQKGKIDLRVDNIVLTNYEP